MGKSLSEREELFLKFYGGMESEADLPPPPYQFGDVHIKFIGIRMKRQAARELLPPELEPLDDGAGLICCYSANSGSVVTPFSACYVAVEVKGYNAPDGSSGYYIATGHYSDRGGEFMRRHYNLNALPGSSRQFREGDAEVGIGGPPGVDALEMRLRAPATVPPFGAGIHHYLGKRPGGGSNVFPIAFNGIMATTEPLSVEISDLASERMKLARPIELTFGLECHMSLTFGLPQEIGEPSRLADNAAQATLLNTFARLGRAALIVLETGEVRNMSAGAKMLLDDGLRIVGGRLRTARAEEQVDLDRLVAAATRSPVDRSALPPIRLTRRDAGPLLVDVVPIGSAATGKPAALLLLNDPAMPSAGNPAAALQLLGLTPAEARIAELVGSGRSPREAAEELANSEGTVRTSLTRIYQKLEINRQAELARIVARL